MVGTAELARAIQGSWLLLRLNPAGMGYFDQSTGGFWRSFQAAVFVLPFYILLRLIHNPDVFADLRHILVHGIAYTMLWTAFPLAMAHLCALMDRRERFIGVIVAGNWATVLQVAIMLAAALIDAAGILPDRLGQALTYLTELGMLVFDGIIFALALRVGALAATGLVLVDIVITLFIQGMALAVIAG